MYDFRPSGVRPCPRDRDTGACSCHAFASAAAVSGGGCENETDGRAEGFVADGSESDQDASSASSTSGLLMAEERVPAGLVLAGARDAGVDVYSEYHAMSRSVLSFLSAKQKSVDRNARPLPPELLCIGGVPRLRDRTGGQMNELPDGAYCRMYRRFLRSATAWREDVEARRDADAAASFDSDFAGLRERARARRWEYLSGLCSLIEGYASDSEKMRLTFASLPAPGILHEVHYRNRVDPVPRPPPAYLGDESQRRLCDAFYRSSKAWKAEMTKRWMDRSGFDARDPKASLGHARECQWRYLLGLASMIRQYMSDSAELHRRMLALRASPSWPNDRRPHKKTAIPPRGGSRLASDRGGVQEEDRQVSRGPPERVVFTSGSTESNNIVLHGVMEHHGNRGVVLTSAIEHPSGIKPLEHLQRITRGGVKVVKIPVDGQGFLDMEELRRAVRMYGKDVKLASFIYASNELGTIQDLGAIRRVLGRDVFFHSDTTQAAGKYVVRGLRYLDSFTVSGHKIHGVKGTGALVVRGDLDRVAPLAYGGSQERLLRPGTESPPLISSLAEAVCRNAKGIRAKTREVGDAADLVRRGMAELGAAFNGPDSPARRVPHLVSGSFVGVDSRAVSRLLAKEGICVSVGSACKLGKRSDVLKAAGKSKAHENGTIRVGVSEYTTESDVRKFLTALRAALAHVSFSAHNTPSIR
eukprot:jgi/Mesvir1/14040/Mv04451-RA.1